VDEREVNIIAELVIYNEIYYINISSNIRIQHKSSVGVFYLIIRPYQLNSAGVLWDLKEYLIVLDKA
jgi:hypothetical protein